MDKYLFNFPEIMETRKLLLALSEKEKRLLAPLSNDTSLIPRICRGFMESECKESASCGKENRKKLLFAIFAIFCPKVLLGGKMPNGMRKEIMKAFPGISPCVVSNNIKEVSVRYRHDRLFREEAEKVYGQIASKFGLLRTCNP